MLFILFLFSYLFAYYNTENNKNIYFWVSTKSYTYMKIHIESWKLIALSLSVLIYFGEIM